MENLEENDKIIYTNSIYTIKSIQEYLVFITSTTTHDCNALIIPTTEFGIGLPSIAMIEALLLDSSLEFSTTTIQKSDLDSLIGLSSIDGFEFIHRQLSLG